MNAYFLGKGGSPFLSAGQLRSSGLLCRPAWSTGWCAIRHSSLECLWHHLMVPSLTVTVPLLVESDSNVAPLLPISPATATITFNNNSNRKKIMLRIIPPCPEGVLGTLRGPQLYPRFADLFSKRLTKDFGLKSILSRFENFHIQKIRLGLFCYDQQSCFGLGVYKLDN